MLSEPNQQQDVALDFCFQLMSPWTSCSGCHTRMDWHVFAAKDPDNFHHLLHKRLDAVLRLCEPRKTVTFALDGPAPVAKLITQRYSRS